jgi:colanic acid biosynthesis glycosyl transferase WcaI
MRILLLSTYFRPDVASTGVIMSTLADEFVARGHEVTVLTSVPHYDINRVWPQYSRKLIYSERVDSMRVYRLYTHVAQDKKNVAQRLLAYGSFNLLSILRGATLPKHDIILVPSPPLSNGVIADLLTRLHGSPFVYVVQDIWPDVAIRAGMLRNRQMIHHFRKMEDYVYRRAAGITVISEGFRTNLLAKGVEAQKISVIPNFIDTSFITPQPRSNSFSRKHGLEDRFVVLFAGNMGFSQGLEIVLDTAKLLEDFHNILFLMVGNGAARQSAEIHLSSLGLGNVRFLPFQPYADLPAMYGASDVCLIPLRQGFTAESVPCKLFTIMAAGKPAIASVDACSDIWHLLKRVQCGLCVEPEVPQSLEDAILFYYRNETARLTAGSNARLCVETEFVPSAIADRYLGAIQQALGTKRHRDRTTSTPPMDNEARMEVENVER